MSKFQVGEYLKPCEFEKAQDRYVTNVIMACVTCVAFVTAITWSTFTFVEGLPPTKAELNCEISTPVCKNGVLLAKYVYLKR